MGEKNKKTMGLSGSGQEDNLDNFKSFIGSLGWRLHKEKKGGLGALGPT